MRAESIYHFGPLDRYNAKPILGVNGGGDKWDEEVRGDVKAICNSEEGVPLIIARVITVHETKERAKEERMNYFGCHLHSRMLFK